MKKNYFKFGILFFVLIISCTKEIEKTSIHESNKTNVTTAPFTDYEIDETILNSLRNEFIFTKAVEENSYKRGMRLIDSLTNGEGVNDENLKMISDYIHSSQTVKLEDIDFLSRKYNCNISSYLAYEYKQLKNEYLLNHTQKSKITTKFITNKYEEKCKKIITLVNSQIKNAYEWVISMKGISAHCDCTPRTTIETTSVSLIDYLLHGSYGNYEYDLFRLIHGYTFGYTSNNMIGYSDYDINKIGPNTDTYFRNLESELIFIGNRQLGQQLLHYIFCHKTHKCPYCNQEKCNCSTGGSTGGGTGEITKCPECGLTSCSGDCYTNKVKNAAPNAFKIFNVSRNVSIDEWVRVEACLRGMIGRDILIKSFTDNKKKLNLINTSDSECIDTRTGNTISLPIENLEHIFVENLFHIYQHNYYGSYDDSYGVNVEFEAKSYFYISDCIYSCGPSVYPAPDFGSEEVTDRYMAWAEECRYCFESGYNMGIMDTDYADFITYLDNANNYNEYYNIHADPRNIRMDALFNLLCNAGGLNPDWGRSINK